MYTFSCYVLWQPAAAQHKLQHLCPTLCKPNIQYVCPTYFKTCKSIIQYVYPIYTTICMPNTHGQLTLHYVCPIYIKPCKPNIHYNTYAQYTLHHVSPTYITGLDLGQKSRGCYQNLEPKNKKTHPSKRVPDLA